MFNEPSENWDDDFVFQGIDQSNSPPRHQRPHSRKNAPRHDHHHDDFLTPTSTPPVTYHDPSEDTTRSRFSFNSAAWDDEPEAGPSSPPRLSHAPNEQHQDTTFTNPTSTNDWTEHADDGDYDRDFGPPSTGNDMDKTVTARRKAKHLAPIKPPPPPRSQSRDQGTRTPMTVHDKSWAEDDDDGQYDRDFADEADEPATQPAPSARAPSAASTSSDSHEIHYQHSQPSSSSLRLAASPIIRGNARRSSPHPSLGSPTASSFSHMPGSPAPSHIPLMHTHTGGSGPQASLLPDQRSPPRVQRPRRRLRKKSRPGAVGDEVFEMAGFAADNLGMLGFRPVEDHEVEDLLFDETDEDHERELQRASSPPILPPVHPSRHPSALRKSTPPPTTNPLIPNPQSPSSPPTILSRIGSMKRWRSRRASVSADPADTSLQSIISPPKTPEPSFGRAATPSSPPSASRGWLFRGSASGSANTSPELHRSGSKSERERPPSRFGRKRSTTVDEVLLEEENLPPLSNSNSTSKGKAKATKVLVSRVLGFNTNHSSTAALDSDTTVTPRPSSPPIRVSGPRRPVSLQPAPRSGAAQSVVSWATGSVGRSTSNPFIATNGNGNVPVKGISKRASSSSVKKHHHRRISYTSDPDEPSMSRTSLTIHESPPPPVPPLPQSVSAGSGISPPLMSPLLPPIVGLSPPSPPRASNQNDTPRGHWNPLTHRTTSYGSTHSSLIDRLAPHSPPHSQSSSPQKKLSQFFQNHSPPSPGQSASLGRATAAAAQHSSQRLLFVANSGGPVTLSEPVLAGAANGGMRRNSLGDLKIPARISMAQTGLRNNLGMVREFAVKVDQLQKLQVVHRGLLNDLHAYSATTILTNRGPGRPDSPEDVSTALSRLDIEYALWWECAELLVELGGSGRKDSPPPPSTPTPDGRPSFGEGSDDDPTIRVSNSNPSTDNAPPKSRERAITLAGDSNPSAFSTLSASSAPTISKSPPRASPPSQWRASTGRNDLSSRQLALLKEMLSTPDPATFNLQLQQQSPVTMPAPTSRLRISSQPIGGLATASAITLPSIVSSPRGESSMLTSSDGHSPGRAEAKGKLRKASRMGLTGLRDMLRSLTNRPPVTTAITTDHADPLSLRTTSSSLASTSEDSHGERHRRRKGSTNPTSSSVKHARSPYNTALNGNGSATHKSPRRPSLASIFRLGQSHSTDAPNGNGLLGSTKRSRKNLRGKINGDAKKKGESENSTTEEDEYSDWDRMDSMSDLEDISHKLGVGRRKPNDSTVKGRHKSRRNTTASQSQADGRTSSRVSLSLQDSPTKAVLLGKPGSGADLPLIPPPLFTNRPSVSQSATVRSVPNVPVSDFRLALTPENIRPLLEYAKEVSARLGECVEEMKALGGAVSSS